MTTSHAGHREVALADGRIPDPPYPGIRPCSMRWPGSGLGRANTSQNPEASKNPWY
jgi:hypothetical protein